jgi:hypothetical protein
MEDVRNLAAKILDEARVMIQANMAQHYRTSRGERWINASGRSSAAFQVEDKDGVHVRLVYKGDDVAPLDTIQYGTTGVPPISVIEQWQRDKGLEGINPWAIRTNIKKRGGTERHVEPQDWVIGPVVEAAVDALNEQLPAAAVRHVRDMLFK